MFGCFYYPARMRRGKVISLYLSYFRHQIANAFGFPLFFEFTLIIMFAVSARISERSLVCSRTRSSSKAVVDDNTGNNKTTPTSCPLHQPSETCYYPSYTGDFTNISMARTPSENDPLLNGSGEVTPQLYSERLITDWLSIFFWIIHHTHCICNQYTLC